MFYECTNKGYIMNRMRMKPPSFNRNSNKLFLIVLHNTLYIQMKIQMDWIVGINIFDLLNYYATDIF